MPQTFFHNSPYSRKYVLIRLTLYHRQPAFRNFVTSQIHDITTFAKVLAD